MKTFLLTAALFLSGSMPQAQVTPARLETVVMITGNGIRMDSLLKTFSRQTGIEFSYHSRKISPATRVPVNRKAWRLREWLVFFQKELGLEYKTVGSHIILFDAAVKKEPAKTPPDPPVRTSVNRKTQDAAALQPSSFSYGHRPAAGPLFFSRITDSSRPQNVPPAQNRYLQNAFPSRMSLVNADPAPATNSSGGDAMDHDSVSSLRPQTRLDLALQGIGLGFERRLGNAVLLDLALGVSVGGYNINSGSIEYNWIPSEPAFYVSFTPRYFYNLRKREARGLPARMNSGNFIGLRLKYTTRSIAENTNIYDALLLNLHWGLQRPLGARWSFSTHAGIGYALDATDLQNTGSTWYPAIDLRFSRILSKVKE